LFTKKDTRGSTAKRIGLKDSCLRRFIIDERASENVVRILVPKSQRILERGVFITNGSASFIEANGIILNITGYTRSEFLCLGMKDLIPDYGQEKKLMHLEKFKLSDTVRTVVEFQRKDFTTGLWLLLVSRLEENRYVGFVHDVSVELITGDTAEVSYIG
jgi:PAS domain S-box-containing protein